VLCTRDLVTSCLCHGRSIAPIVLTCQHEDRAFLGIDLADAGAAVPAAEVEVKVFVEDPVGLGGIQMPDELEVLQRCRGTHNAVHLFWIVEGLIDVGRTVVELPLHVEVVGPCKGIVPPAPTSSARIATARHTCPAIDAPQMIGLFNFKAFTIAAIAPT